MHIDRHGDEPAASRTLKEMVPQRMVGSRFKVMVAFLLVICCLEHLCMKQGALESLCLVSNNHNNTAETVTNKDASFDTPMTLSNQSKADVDQTVGGEENETNLPVDCIKIRGEHGEWVQDHVYAKQVQYFPFTFVKKRGGSSKEI